MRKLTAKIHSRRSSDRKKASVIFRIAFCCLLLAACCLLSFGGVWTKQQTGTLAWLHAVHFIDEQRGWAVGGKGALLATTDGGRHWQTKKSATEDSLEDVYFADERTGWLVCQRSIYLLKTADETRSYLLHTTDGGATWTRVEAAGKDVDARLMRIVFADRTRGFVFGELGAMYATTDGGATWTRQRVPTRHLLLDGVFLDAQQGWIVGAGATLLQTSDGGATWREGRIENVPVSQSSNTAGDAVAATDASNIFTSSPASNSFPILQSRGAATRLNAVSFVDARAGWAVGAGGAIFATSNGGRTWRALSSPTTADLLDVKFFDQREGWAIGAGGTVLHTIDGGLSWQLEPTRTPHPLERLSFAGRTRGWAVGFGGTIMAYAPAAPDNPAPRPKLRGVASSSHNK